MTAVPIPPYGGCVWPVDPACLTTEWDAFDPAVQERSLALASATLRRLSGYRVGGCPVTVRPCKAGCATSSTRPSWLDMIGAYGASGFFPHIEGGVWVNSCGCAGDCSCGPECRIALPAPVGRVDEVRVDGIAVTDWVLDGDGILWTGDTECPWPTCQDMTLDDTEPGTFSVTYLNAWPVDSLGAYAAGILAMEFARACAGGKCRLPAGVTTIARQGVSMEIAAGSFPNGFTGLREVDAWIALWNPQPIRETTKVWYPGMPVARVTR